MSGRRSGRRPSDAMFGKGREGECVLRNLQTPRAAYIAVRNEATTTSLLSEPVAAHTRKCAACGPNRSGNAKASARISYSALRKLSAKPRAFAAYAAPFVKVLLR